MTFPPCQVSSRTDKHRDQQPGFEGTRIIEWRGAPLAIRVDNGPEYISDCLIQWAKARGIAIQHIQPGKLQQNAYVERHNRTVRHEWFDQYTFATIKGVQTYATDWL